MDWNTDVDDAPYMKACWVTIEGPKRMVFRGLRSAADGQWVNVDNLASFGGRVIAWMPYEPPVPYAGQIPRR